MRLPKEDSKRLDTFIDVREQCLSSRQKRLDQYRTLRAAYLYGNADGGPPSSWNMIYDGIDLLTSFLYAADSTKFSVVLDAAAPKTDLDKTTAFNKKINKKWKKSQADIVFGNSLTWAFVYDTTIVKHIRRQGTVHPFMIDPASFGVYREDTPMLDRQEAFVHTYYITIPDLTRRLALHPRRDEILKLIHGQNQVDTVASSTPPLVERVLMSSVTPNLVGEANIMLDAPPDYRADLPNDLVEMSELWIWDDSIDDYQTITMAEDLVVIYDRRNIFLPRMKDWEAEHGFVQVCPNPLPDYFWGQSEVSRLLPIQARLDLRLGEIEKLNSKQVDPPSAWMGMGLVEDKLAALNDPGAQIAIGGDATNRREKFDVVVPSDIYKEVDRLEERFLQAMGISNVLQGKGESGVRSAGHASKLATLGSSRARKRALIVEESLAASATLYGRCTYVDDDDEMIDEKGLKFIASQLDPDFDVEVDAHSNSPVFAENKREDALILFKAKAINRKRLIGMLAPPKQDEIVRELETIIEPAEKAAAEARAKAEAMDAAAKAGGKLQSVK